MNHWVPMARENLPQVNAMADAIHTDYPEEEAVFEERLKLFPEGCFVLLDPEGLSGYCVSHPWLKGAPPKLNSLLREIPEKADTYYVHDIAILPAKRGAGAATEILNLLRKVAIAHRMTNMTLVAVNGSEPFWRSRGFSVIHHPEAETFLATYGDDASVMQMRF